jgi:hypothetical protein
MKTLPKHFITLSVVCSSSGGLAIHQMAQACWCRPNFPIKVAERQQEVLRHRIRDPTVAARRRVGPAC